MIGALLLATATPAGVIDAERAFAAAAKARGQWTAFREFAAPEATMFVPQPVKAQEWLKDRADPPRPIDWWPTAAWVSCDGTVAVDTGGWRRPDGAVGYFTTVWKRQPEGGWKWIVDSGDVATKARPRIAMPRVQRASCRPQITRPGDIIITGEPRPTAGVKSDMGGPADNSLTWLWMVRADGSRWVMASFWNGVKMTDAVADRVAPPK